MHRNATRRHFAVGLLFGLVAVVGSAKAQDEESPKFPVDPEIASPRFEITEGKSLTTAGITLYVAGALYDLYTTKRAMDADSRSPIRSSADRTTPSGRSRRRRSQDRLRVPHRTIRATQRPVRGSWFLSCGALQLGLGIANSRATQRERAITSVAPAPQPLPPGDAAEPAPTPPDETAAQRRSRIHK
jgi:hypothetical protein